MNQEIIVPLSLIGQLEFLVLRFGHVKSYEINSVKDWHQIVW